ncbi:MAG: protein kinase [Deltaproteobacteria bacterium]|nr:protein kinase [Deltaproteobacteria bacterium]
MEIDVTGVSILDLDDPPTGGVTSVTSGLDAPIKKFRGLAAKAMPTSGAEAEIYILTGPEGRYILKLYHQGLNPKENVLKKITEVSQRLPQFVVRIHESGYDKETNRWFEIMEFVELGSLANWIQNGQVRKFDFNTLVSQLTEAVDALQTADMVHRDLKPSNVLVRSAEPMALVLADFGITSVMHNVSLRAGERNFTPEYAPPEMDLASKAGDWWSMGIIFYEVLTGTIPFENMSFEEILLALTKPVDVPIDLDPRQQLLLKGLLTRDIEHRWRAKQIRLWLTGQNPKTYYDVERAFFKQGDGRAPFNFLGREFFDLKDVALAMSISDVNWQSGAKYLARGYMVETLRKRGDRKDEAKVESLACGDSNEFVFRFVHSYLEQVPVYRSLPMTVENLYAASQATDSNLRSPEGEFVRRTLSRGWDLMLAFLFESTHPKIQQLFLSIVFYIQTIYSDKNPVDIQTFKNIMFCAFNPALFFWGTLPKVKLQHNYQLVSHSGINNVTFSINYQTDWTLRDSINLRGKLLPLKEYNNLGGNIIVLPQGVAKLLSSPNTYFKGIINLKDRKNSRKLLLSDNLPAKMFIVDNHGNKIFSNSDKEYDDYVKVHLWKFTPGNLEVLNTTKENLMSFIENGKFIIESDTINNFIAKVLNGAIKLNDADIDQFRIVANYTTRLAMLTYKIRDIIPSAIALIIAGGLTFYFAPRFSVYLKLVTVLCAILLIIKISLSIYLKSARIKIREGAEYVEGRMKKIK